MTEPQKAERDAFEKWLIREKGHFPDAIERMHDGDRYWHEPIQRLWEAWQATFEAGRSAREWISVEEYGLPANLSPQNPVLGWDETHQGYCLIWAEHMFRDWSVKWYTKPPTFPRAALKEKP